MKNSSEYASSIELCKKLASLSPKLKEIYDEDSNHDLEGAPLPYLIISHMVRHLESKPEADDELEGFMQIINEAWDTSHETHEGINNFLGAGFIEALSGPEKYTKEKQPVITPEIVNRLRPELKTSYDTDWPS